MKDAPDTPAALQARALRHLARREHSRVELARKLAPHAASPDSLQALLDELQAKKQLSDERFAEERACALSRKYGPAKIRQDLRAKGISDETIYLVSRVDEAGKAKEILERRYRQPATSREERAKRARFLQARGFSNDIIRRLLDV